MLMSLWAPRTKDLLFYVDEMKAVAGNLYVTTDDGSYRIPRSWNRRSWKNLVNGGNHYDHCVAIGPMIMMKFVCILTKELGHSYRGIHESDHGGRNRYVWCLSSGGRR